MNQLSKAALLLMVAGIVSLYFAHALIVKSPVVIAFQAAGVGLMIWARATFGRRSFHATASPTEGGLVTSGPYRFIRHPIYTAASLFCWPGALANPSWWSIASAALVTAGGIGRMLSEETLLVERYPAYREYARTTKRMVPYLF